MSPTQNRLLYGTLAILLGAFSISTSHEYPLCFLFVVLCFTIITLCLLEFYNICKAKGHDPFIKVAIVGSNLYLAFLFAHILGGLPSFFLQTTLFATLFASFFVAFAKGQTPLVNLSLTLFGLSYILVPLSSIIGLNYFAGWVWVAYLLAVTKMSDIGGFFFGRCLGEKKLAPLLSPKKTIEGALGALATAVVTSIFIWWIADLPISLTISIVFGIILGVFAQVGDLAESLLKRDAGIKDSSNIPGLGGILDMMDSLIFTAPLLYFLLQVGGS